MQDCHQEQPTPHYCADQPHAYPDTTWGSEPLRSAPYVQTSSEPENPGQAPTPIKRAEYNQHKQTDAVKIQLNLQKQFEVPDFSKYKYTSPIGVVRYSLRVIARLVSVCSTPAQDATNV